MGKMSHIIFFPQIFHQICIYQHRTMFVYQNLIFHHYVFLLLQEHVPLDVESELREAMSDTVQKTADGEKRFAFSC